MPMKATTPKATGSVPGGGGWRPLGCCWKRGIDGAGDGGGGERRLCAESPVTSDIARDPWELGEDGVRVSGFDRPGVNRDAGGEGVGEDGEEDDERVTHTTVWV
jgi:hypothetical protein